MKTTRTLVIVFSAIFAISRLTRLSVLSAAQQPPAPPFGAAQGAPSDSRGALTAKTAAPIDITGYWVAVITEDWRWRMLTPPKGDYASVPINNEGRRVADGWDLAKDEAAGLQCKPYGVGNIMRMPGRMHITWQDDTTLKVDFDAGTQTRLLHFGPSTGSGPSRAESRDGQKPAAPGPPSWQGYSHAEW